MSKGRKAEAGTYEARNKLQDIIQTIESCNTISTDAKARAIKALCFGLGVKSAEEAERIQKEKVARLKAELAELEGKEINSIEVKEKATKKNKKGIDTSGDEYFTPENCIPA